MNFAFWLDKSAVKKSHPTKSVVVGVVAAVSWSDTDTGGWQRQAYLLLHMMRSQSSAATWC